MEKPSQGAQAFWTTASKRLHVAGLASRNRNRCCALYNGVGMKGLSDVRVALALPLGLIPAACSVDRPHVTGPTTQASAQPVTQPQVPVVYADYEWPAALSDAQTRSVLKTANENRPKDRDIWFVMVVANRLGLLHGPVFRCVVYYAPDELSRDLRRGRCLDMSLGFPPRVREYAQVSPAEEPFGDALKVPRLPDVPFSPLVRGDAGTSVAFKADELVQLVRCVRGADIAEGVDPGMSRVLIAGERDEPILAIRVHGDEYEVETGWVAGMLDGRGHVLRFRRESGEYRLVDVMLWKS